MRGMIKWEVQWLIKIVAKYHVDMDHILYLEGYKFLDAPRALNYQAWKTIMVKLLTIAAHINNNN